MNFNTYFRLTSYATVAAAALALFVAGGIGVLLTLAFAILMLVSWKLEGSRWQLTERMALVAIIVSLPVFYFDWKVLSPLFANEITDGSIFVQSGGRGAVEVGVLAHMILFLSAVKLLQRKGDRDWFFVYLISFFQVLLAAGLTVEPEISCQSDPLSVVRALNRRGI